jgi:ribonuclease III
MSAQFDLPKFRNAVLFDQAMTHRSYLNEHPDITVHNERLEFLGDAILNFLSGEFLYRHYPQKPEGELTPLRSLLVDEQQLANFARLVSLGNWLKLGKGAERDGGRQNANLLSSAFEAMIGAYFLDAEDAAGASAVQAYMEPLFARVTVQLDIVSLNINYKSRLQEWALAKHGEIPQYTITGQSGPDHAKVFIAEVSVQGHYLGNGTGRRKQDAEKAAARDALEGLGLLQSLNSSIPESLLILPPLPDQFPQLD